MLTKSATRLWAFCVGLCSLGAGQAATAAADDVIAAAVQHGAGTSDANRAGIWKAVIPPNGSMHGEFDNNDPIGLAAGSRIATDCSLNWVDPDFGKIYCFSSATSLVYFLDSPRAFLARARKNWAALSHGG